jgi:molybdopterin converting factor small subunit
MKPPSMETKKEATLKVTIEIISWLKEDFDHEGWDKLILEETIRSGTSIMDLLHYLAEKYPKFGQKAFVNPAQDFLDYCAVILNGSFRSNLAALNTDLKEGDNLKLSPGFYGG